MCCEWITSEAVTSVAPPSMGQAAGHVVSFKIDEIRAYPFSKYLVSPPNNRKQALIS